jgi:hypothetical protein
VTRRVHPSAAQFCLRNDHYLRAATKVTPRFPRPMMRKNLLNKLKATTCARSILRFSFYFITSWSKLLFPYLIFAMYLDLMNGHTPFLRKYLWKLKIPLKIKKFMLFLNNKVLLTKDNLVKRNWHGCTKCCFCNEPETINHLFLSCPFAKIVWRMIYFTFGIHPPANITNMFGNWLNGVHKLDKNRIRIGISAVCWSIWTNRNDIIFNRQKGTNFLQVIRRAAY